MYVSIMPPRALRYISIECLNCLSHSSHDRSDRTCIEFVVQRCTLLLTVISFALCMLQTAFANLSWSRINARNKQMNVPLSICVNALLIKPINWFAYLFYWNVRCEVEARIHCDTLVFHFMKTFQVIDFVSRSLMIAVIFSIFNRKQLTLVWMVDESMRDEMSA